MLSERAHLCRTLRVSSCAPTWCRSMGTCPFPPLHPLAPPPSFLLSTGPIYSRAITVPVLGALAADLEDQHHQSSRQRGPTSWAEPTRPAVGRFVIQPTPTHSFSCFFFFFLNKNWAFGLMPLDPLHSLGLMVLIAQQNVSVTGSAINSAGKNKPRVVHYKCFSFHLTRPR